jgi:phage terminase large subunit
MDKHTCSRAEVLEMIKENKFVDFFFGLDWGWEHPTAICLYGVTMEGVYYQIDELKKVHFDHINAKEWLKNKQTEYSKFWRFGNCDNARPEQNEKLRDSFYIYEDKPVSVSDSIAIVRQLINFDRLIICRDNCPETIQEITNYRYPQEYEITAVTDIDKPIKEFDDCMDAMRYGVWFYETNFGARFKQFYVY